MREDEEQLRLPRLRSREGVFNAGDTVGIRDVTCRADEEDLAERLFENELGRDAAVGTGENDD
jgi:hypothetical protein